MGEYEAAIADFNKAIRIDPTKIDAHLELEYAQEMLAEEDPSPIDSDFLFPFMFDAQDPSDVDPNFMSTLIPDSISADSIESTKEAEAAAVVIAAADEAIRLNLKTQKRTSTERLRKTASLISRQRSATLMR